MSMAVVPDARMKLIYDMAEVNYLRSLPPEHFMEAYAQGAQRQITLASLALVREARPEVQVFNELLVQYHRPGADKPGQVVPDNMVVVHPEPIVVEGSLDIPFQPARPLLVLEYVSKHHKRKDYEDNLRRYEQELKVPYYLLFYPDALDLTVFRLAGDRYVSVLPNDLGRLAIPELELEVALVEEWVRFWFRGTLLPLPAELIRQLREARAEATSFREQATAERAARTLAERHAADAEQRATTAEAELAQLREELARVRAGGGGSPPGAS